MPVGEAGALPRTKRGDVWSELSAIKCPTLVIRGAQSDRYPPEIVERIRKARPDFQWASVASKHDIAHGAREETVAAIRKFVADV